MTPGDAGCAEPERCRVGVVEVAPGRALDLDTGELLDESDPRAELACGADGLRFLVPAQVGRSAAPALPWVSDAPWRTLRTREGRTAWVQVLSDPPQPPRSALARPEWPVPELRFVTAPRGVGEAPPAPEGPFCIGSDAGIAVWFGRVPASSRYVIERRVGPGGSFEPAGEVAAPPFIDAAARPGVRYGYRITGYDRDGLPGIPALVQGTTASRGVRRGRVAVPWVEDGPRGIDVLADRVVREGGDLVLLSSLAGGSSSRVAGSTGRLRMRPAEVSSPPFSPWTPHDMPWTPDVEGRPDELDPACWSIASVFGGGVVMFRASWDPGAVSMVFDYLVDPDRPAFQSLHSVETCADGDGAIIRVTMPAGWTSETVESVDLISRATRPSISARDGLARDPAAGPGSIVEYAPVVRDAQGRAQMPVTAVLNRLAPGLRSGEVELAAGEGFSFLSGRVVQEPGGADVIYRGGAGGGATSTLDAPRGLTNVARCTGWHEIAAEAGDVLDAIAGVRPGAVRLVSRCDGTRGRTGSEVFVVRLPGEGWAKLAVVERTAPGRGGVRARVRLRYAFDPVGAVLTTVAGRPFELGGLRLLRSFAPGVSTVPR